MTKRMTATMTMTTTRRRTPTRSPRSRQQREGRHCRLAPSSERASPLPQFL